VLTTQSKNFIWEAIRPPMDFPAATILAVPYFGCAFRHRQKLW